MKSLQIAVLAALVALSAAALAEAPDDFSGEWVAAEAGPAGAASNPGVPQRHGAGGESRRGHSGFGARRHGGERPRPAEGASAAGSGAAVPRLHAQALTIRQSEVVFDIASDGGSRMVYRFDNRNNYGPAYGGTVSLNWAAPEMIVETHPDAGGSVEEHYALSADRKRLTLRIHAVAANGGAARDLTRVFVRAGAQDGSTALP